MIRLLVNNTPVDLSADFDISINKAIADIREPQSRSSEWTKTITIPGTAQNNKLFSHIFEVEHTIRTSTQFAPDFNPNKKADVVVLLDEIEQLRGFIRLIQINVLGSTQIEYQCSLHGQTADLFTTIAERKLNVLDFSEYNHTLSSGAVIDSWDTSITKNGSSQAFAYGSGYMYALIDKGYSKTQNITQFEVSSMTPCLYAKTIVDKIFTDAGYSYTADSYFNNDRFKRLVVTPPNGLTVSSAVIEQRRFKATRTTTQSLSLGTTLIFNNDSTSGNYDNGNNYNNGTGAYVVPVAGEYVFDLTLNMVCNIGTYSPLYPPDNFTIAIGMYVNNVLVKTATFQQTFGVFPIVNDVHLVYSRANIGDSVTFKLTQVYDSLNNTTLVNSNFTLDVLTNSFVENDCTAFTFGYGETVDFTQFLNSEVKQSDMLMSFVKMFNLYIEPDKDQPKKLRLVPRDDFYNGVNVDWTYKLDYSQPVEIVPMGELDANPYMFSYKQGGDISNQEYQEMYQTTYGSRTYQVDNDFVKTEKKIDIVFSPTQIKNYPNAQKNFVLSYVDSEKDGDLRILYYGGLQTGVSWRLYPISYMLPFYSNRASLPLTLHYDSISNPTFDILFGMPRELGVGAGYKYGNSNLVTNFYYRFITEITNKNSKIVRAFFRITPSDWFNLQFKNLYFFEGQYWRLNKVNDYNPMQDGVYQCEFLLAQFIPPATITNKTIGSGTGGGQSEEINGDIYPAGNFPIKPGIKGVSVGTSQDSGMGVFVGTGVVNDSVNVNNSGLGMTNVAFPIGVDGSVAIVCEDFEVTKSDTMYVGNYEMYPNFLSGGDVKTITTSYTATKDDYLFLLNPATGGMVLTLPDPTGLSGKYFAVKKITAAHSVTIATTGTAKIDGADTHSISGHWTAHDIVTDGIDYFLMGEK
jgi:hypothetical protein